MKKLILGLILFLPSASFADTFAITVSTDVAAKIKNAYGTAYGYSPTLPDGSQNPETLAQFTLRMIKQQIRDFTVGFDVNQAAQTQRQSTINQENSSVVIP